MKLKSCAITDVGCKRQENEDTYLSAPEIGLFAVADGMGGHAGGAHASRLAIDTLAAIMRGMTEDPETTVIAGVNRADDEYGFRLKHAIQVASSKIFDEARYDASLQGMGTTTAALLFQDGAVYIANVGDSRAYLLRGSQLNQITEDHSLVGEQVRAGLIDKKDARNHKLKNVITRSVGFQADVEIDLSRRPVKKGDRFLLCTDGLTNFVQDSEIQDILLKSGLEEALKALVALANSRGGDDNVTLVAIEVVDPS